MRKELGKPARDRFFSRLREVAPEFRRSAAYDIKGFTWSFLRREGELRQWLWFQRHKYEDAFTVELSWSCKYDSPAQPPSGAPSDPFRPEGCRFRLGSFWNEGGDFWWQVTDPPPSFFEAPPEDYVRNLLEPPAVDPVAAAPRIRSVVDDAIARIEQHALPYFERVSVWAKARQN